MVCEILSVSDITSWFNKTKSMSDPKIHSWDNLVDIPSYHLLYCIFMSWYSGDDDMVSITKDTIESIKYEPSDEEKLLLMYKGIEYLNDIEYDEDDLYTHLVENILSLKPKLNDELLNLYINDGIFALDVSQSINYNYVKEEVTLPDKGLTCEVVRFLDMVSYIEYEYDYDLEEYITT